MIERYSSFETVSYFLDIVVFSEIKHMKRNADALPETFFVLKEEVPGEPLRSSGVIDYHL